MEVEERLDLAEFSSHLLRLTKRNITGHHIITIAHVLVVLYSPSTTNLLYFLLKSLQQQKKRHSSDNYISQYSLVMFIHRNHR